MILVIETATSACSVALMDDGVVFASVHEEVGRGHAERLLPMIASLPGGGRADAILVDCGPGSFTGIRVGVAAARALGLGWSIPVHGYSSLALLAAVHFATHGGPTVAIAIPGGHGELFVQPFASDPLREAGSLSSRLPADAAALFADIAMGATLRASDAGQLDGAFVALPPRPIYGRAPDAKPMA